MSVCFHGYGSIRLKKETAQEFADKFKELLEKYSGNKKFMCNEDGLLQFKNFARHFFMSECKQLIEDNIDKIIDGRLCFNCGDEDGSCDRPFPFYVLVEIVNGKLFEETLETRLPGDWYLRYADGEWLYQET